ncbi:hypothetical protein [Amaricoccus solimangrovi]|uniref:Uncharacterized protein n=1 Tax=Amaricoccus solimangrovi TaxID=2589815 RepID=A0A501WV17_9RHOB|nr:hypothetical protein [Amaricoccus solimangrovi]TPE52582.1 hypothetical protein FJM51_05230 [Amaricoccus solimangrovi]
MPRTRAEIAALVASNLPDNTSRFIEPGHIRALVTALLDAAAITTEAPWSGAISSAIAAAASAYATAAQGTLAASAVQPAAMSSAIDAAIATAVNGIRPLAGVRQVAATAWTVAPGDLEYLIECVAAGAVTVTLPADAAAPVPVGASVHVCGAGAGGLTFAAGAGATLARPAAAALALAGPGSVATAIKVAADSWRLIGDLGAAA